MYSGYNWEVKNNYTKMEDLHDEWGNGVLLIATTDGDFGENIGLRGYTLVCDEDEEPILKGYAADTSIFDTMESIREELLVI